MYEARVCVSVRVRKQQIVVLTPETVKEQWILVCHREKNKIKLLLVLIA